MPGIPEPLGCSAPGPSPSVPSRVCLTVAPFGPGGAQPGFGRREGEHKGRLEPECGSLLSRLSAPSPPHSPRCLKGCACKNLDPQAQFFFSCDRHSKGLSLTLFCRGYRILLLPAPKHKLLPLLKVIAAFSSACIVCLGPSGAHCEACLLALPLFDRCQLWTEIEVSIPSTASSGVRPGCYSDTRL